MSVPSPVVTRKHLTVEQSELSKFVQINWCGDGVPEARKGLFYSHSTAVANYLRGSHVVISARNEVCRVYCFVAGKLTLFLTVGRITVSDYGSR